MTPREDAGDVNAPPAGGFGAPQPFQHTKIGHRPIRAKPTSWGAIIVSLAILAFLGALVGIGVWKYGSGVRRVPSAEARNTIGQIGKDLAVKYEDTGTLCPSARAIPAALSSVRGKKYPSQLTEWQSDPGWVCAKFEMYSPQYYQYRFETKGDEITVIAEGDLDGDGVPSRFELHGHVDADKQQLVLEPNIRMTNPDE